MNLKEWDAQYFRDHPSRPILPVLEDEEDIFQCMIEADMRRSQNYKLNQ